MNPRRLFPLSALLLASAAVTLPAGVPASANHTTLFALEVFAPEGAVPAPRCATNNADVQPAASVDLPAGTVPVAVLQGSLPSGVRGCRVTVSIGGGTTFGVYKSADTVVRKRPVLRSGVRVVASRDEQTGVLVAEKIVGRQVARNEIERGFVATVDVDSTGVTQWLTTEVGGLGRQFTFDVTGADVEPGLASPVAVQFDTVAPVPD
jgi:hypothetical protein